MAIRRALLFRSVSLDINKQDPETLQRIASSGKASQYYSIGDYINIPWTDNAESIPITYQFPFVVVDIADAYDENDVKHENAIWLMARYAEPYDIPFDVPERIEVDLSTEPNALADWYYWGATNTSNGGSSYTKLDLSVGDTIPTTYDSIYRCGINNSNVLMYGYNKWKDSAYRQWLNSDAAKNVGWWTPQHTGDVAPDASYTNKPGWLNGFTEEWKAIFKPIRVSTKGNGTTDYTVNYITFDKFFLPSVVEMYGVEPNIGSTEGKYWPYWKNVTGFNSPSNGTSSNTNNARKIPTIASPTGSAVFCRLRTVGNSQSHTTWHVSNVGYLGGTVVSTPEYSLPACVIY